MCSCRQECLISIYWLYERKPEEWMIDLCYKLYAQGLDYKILFDNWRFDKPQERGRWNFMTHVVNIDMALKSEALISKLTGSDGNATAKKALELLKLDHSMAAGHFTKVPDYKVPIGEAQEKMLIPYGCTCLRFTEAPVLSCGEYNGSVYSIAKGRMRGIIE